MIREVCSCSAEFETDEDDAIALVREWRRKHLHEMLNQQSPTFFDKSSSHDIAPGFVRDTFEE